MPETAARKAWLEANRERLRAYHKAWRDAHKDRIRAYGENYKAQDPEEFTRKGTERANKHRATLSDDERKARYKKYNANQKARRPEVVKAQARKNITKWRKLNPERHRELNRLSSYRNRETSVINSQIRRARLRAAPGKGVTRKEWREIKESYLGLCAYCNTRPAKLVMDHIDALNKGGAHEPSNIAPACGPCNSSKSDHKLIVWLTLKQHAKSAA